jgi:hypothetical protein
MPPIDHQALEAEQDLAFERQLLDSARSDALPPAAVHAAWARFAGATTALAAHTGGVKVARGIPASTKAVVAAKWLAVGALCGSSLTAAWLRSKPSALPTPGAPVASSTALPARREPTRASSTALVSSADPSLPLSDLPLGLRPPAVPTSVAPDLTATPNVAQRGAVESQTRFRGERRPLESTAPLAPLRDTGPAPASARRSTLAAEVSLLDTARAASFADAYRDALRLVDDYHRQFPAGELAADAEVVAIDALAAEHSALAVERAKRFLEHYPNDPHAAHVKSVAQRE